MGRGFKGGRNRGKEGRGGGGGGGRQQQDNRVSFEAIDKTNEKFERFYNSIDILAAGEEREAFWTAIRKELPNSFRFTGSKGHALGVRKNLVERHFPKISGSTYNDEKVELPTVIPWYPDGLAYTMAFPKNILRKWEPLKDFQKFLVHETGVGNISRQEVVSMIPPLVLDIQPHHAVLDLCAAPGSKSAQLIEMIHAGEEERVQQTLDGSENASSSPEAQDSGRASGVLVANDVDYRRAQMLTHQVKRLNSPNIIVTNHDATQFPSIALSKSAENRVRYLQFDRVLADVPCSGDGTCRKNPGIWKDWSPQNALGLYITQVRILVRALQLLGPGGRVVYSTCSMNPVENEAVVSSAIERCGGSAKVRLVDCSDKLPALKRKPGLNDWSVMNRAGTIYESWAEVVGGQEEKDNSKLVPGMFPPCEDEENVNLERCMRLYPHLQDTGAFFVAVLERTDQKLIAKPEEYCKCFNKDWTPGGGEKTETENTADVSDATGLKRKVADEGEPESERIKRVKSEPTQNGSQQGTGMAKLRRDGRQPEVEAFKYLEPNHPELETIVKFYEIHERFPRDRFLVRNHSGDPKKGIYYSCKLVKDILIANEDRHMKFVHAGVKMFMKQDVQGLENVCKWRIQSEGLSIIEGWVSEKRVIRMKEKSTLHTLLKNMFLKIQKKPDQDDATDWRDLGEIGPAVRDMTTGCGVLRVAASEGENGLSQPLVLPIWRSINSVNVMLPKEDRTAMLLRLFGEGEDGEILNHSTQKRPQENGEATSGQRTQEEPSTTHANGEDRPMENGMANVPPSSIPNGDEADAVEGSADDRASVAPA